MPIAQGSIKLMASQLLTDDQDAGGMMSGNEVVDGNVNNLFPDISRLGRTVGRVSMRKAFPFVSTDDNDTYYGAHLILSQAAEDPNVSVTVFGAGSPSDQRSDARDRVESYVVQGSAFSGYLTGNQLQGARSLQIIQRETMALPRVGEVLYLAENEGQVDEASQYVRITDVESEIRDYTWLNGNSLAEFSRRLVVVTIGDKLRHTFHGSEPTPMDSPGAAKTYVTHVADATSYYGVKPLVSPAAADDLTIRVASIYNHLVPSAQAETPAVDVLAGGNVAALTPSGESEVSFTTSVNMAAGVQLFCGVGVTPGTLTVSGGGAVWADDSTGAITRSGDIEGNIDYGPGEILFAAPGVTGVMNLTVSFTPAYEASGCNLSAKISVELANRGYNYTATLSPKPSPGTLTVDYMAQGQWYRMRDNGAGELIPLIPNTGTGVLQDTGSCIVTCGALPDVGSVILFQWGAPVEMQIPETTTINKPFKTQFTFPSAPLEPGSVSFTFDGVAVTDDGAGGLTGIDGDVSYPNGVVTVSPDTIKASAAINIDIDALYRTADGGAVQSTGSVSVTAGPQGFAGTMAPAKAGSVMMTGVPFAMEGKSATGTVLDNGSGKLILHETVIVGSEADQNYWTIYRGKEVGTVDYATGDFLLYGEVQGRHWEKNRNLLMSHTSNGEPVYQWSAAWSCPLSNVSRGAGSITWSLFPSATSYTDSSGQVSSTSFNAQISADIPGNIAKDAAWINIGEHKLIAKNGVLYKEYNPATGVGVIAGSLSTAGDIALTAGFTADAANVMVVRSMVTKQSDQLTSQMTFRTPGAPVRPGSLYIQGRDIDGNLIAATASVNGVVDAPGIEGTVNAETGVVFVRWGEWLEPAADYTAEPWYSSELVDGNRIWRPLAMQAGTITYNCVIYSYIPLNADLVGLDPVRLPQDGRVPIFRDGYVVVIHHTASTTLPAGLTSGQQISLPRGDLSNVELYDADDIYVPATNYITDLTTGVVKMASPLDLSGFTQPLVASHRREDMRLVSDVQINGDITLTAPLSHDYPAEETLVSGALLLGDLQSRVSHFFDQKTWGNVWSDSLIGDSATATYNTLNYPITCTNKGAIDERWALKFDSSEHFQIIGETVGVIGEGYITNDCSPINPATNEPYFTVRLNGWGSGWYSGNVLRFNTRGAQAGVWFVRTTLQAQETEPSDQFTAIIRGDAA